jgi:SAM-dependent methyltransferase
MLPFSAAAENNKRPILEKLREAFAKTSRVLEISSGTGQHAVFFAEKLPHLDWRPSDLEEHLPSLEQRIVEADAELDNLLAPIELDIADLPWPVSASDYEDAYDGIFSSNSLHIVSWPLVEAFFEGVGETLAPGGTLCVYGPFKYGGKFTTPSNEAFDKSLKEKDPESGIRDFEAVNELAEKIGLKLVADHAMPANNQLLVWTRS